MMAMVCRRAGRVLFTRLNIPGNTISQVSWQRNSSTGSRKATGFRGSPTAQDKYNVLFLVSLVYDAYFAVQFLVIYTSLGSEEAEHYVLQLCTDHLLFTSENFHLQTRRGRTFHSASHHQFQPLYQLYVDITRRTRRNASRNSTCDTIQLTGNLTLTQSSHATGWLAEPPLPRPNLCWTFCNGTWPPG